MNPQQLTVNMHVLQCIHNRTSGLFFDGPGGTGETFVYPLSHAIRGQGRIILCVASSGIASILLPGVKLHTPALVSDWMWMRLPFAGYPRMGA